MSSLELSRELSLLQQSIMEDLNEARRLVRNAPSHIKAQAEAYWIPNATMAITADHDWCGNGGFSMEKTIKDLEEDEPKEDDD